MRIKSLIIIVSAISMLTTRAAARQQTAQQEQQDVYDVVARMLARDAQRQVSQNGYEGMRRMVLIFVLGLMFGFLALWRKSLRPGMIGHAVFDSAQGVLLFIATRTGVLSSS